MLTLVRSRDDAATHQPPEAAYAANTFAEMRCLLSETGQNCSIAAVIPTRGRPQMVLAAVRSAFAQTLLPSEVIVVIDGPESVPESGETTAGLLASFERELLDGRLRVLTVPVPVGGGEARNLGVRAARAHWIAFLDDDDLWLPEKLATQFRVAGALPGDVIPVLSCPVVARSPRYEEVWPRERPRPRQPMAEYLFCRRGWRYGSALLQTSTLLCPRELMLRIPFTPGLRKHQDWDWLLRAAAEPGVHVELVGEQPLAIFHVEGERSSVGRVRDWRFSLGWAMERRRLFTRRALCSFVATECAAQAETAGWRDRAAVFWTLLRLGVPTWRELAQVLTFLLAPRDARRLLRNMLRPRSS